MKKYKLIKEYPGSPKLGNIVELGKLQQPNYSNYPEFWQEIIEKDYEILSFSARTNIYKVCEDGNLLLDYRYITRILNNIRILTVI